MKKLIEHIRAVAAQHPHLKPELREIYELAREESEDTSEQNAVDLAMQEIKELLNERQPSSK